MSKTDLKIFQPLPMGKQFMSVPNRRSKNWIRAKRLAIFRTYRFVSSVSSSTKTWISASVRMQSFWWKVKNFIIFFHDRFFILFRLLFPLCGACIEQSEPRRCLHSENERILHGCWTNFELKFAVEKQNYKLLSVTERWTWDTWDDKLFEPMIKQFLRLKIQVFVTIFLSKSRIKVPF